MEELLGNVAKAMVVFKGLQYLLEAVVVIIIIIFMFRVFRDFPK